LVAQNQSSPAPYLGRFAPSPSGPLHLGSLIAAVASYLDAKANQGQWLLRIEDVDELRTIAGAETSILQALEAHGLYWDTLTPKQSERKARYQAVFNQLCQNEKIFACNCPRKMLRQQGGGAYPGYCRDRKITNEQAQSDWLAKAAFRFNTTICSESSIRFSDRIQGEQYYLLADLGDFVVRRRDQLFAYQLAVVVDDQDQGVTHIVRGNDLIDSTPWQIALQKSLEFNACHYAHLPVVMHGESKLSKQTGAQALNLQKEDTQRQLLWALERLGQTQAIQALGIDSHAQALPDCRLILDCAVSFWQITSIPSMQTYNMPSKVLLP